MSNPLLEVQDLHVHFPLGMGPLDWLRQRPGPVVRAVNGVDLRLAPGETLGLVGESGCGKSTLGRALLGLERPTGGRVCFEGADLQRLGPMQLSALRRRTQMVFQDPHASLNPRLSVGQALAEPLRVHGLRTPAEIPGRIAELMETVGLSPDLASRRPRALSGGQCQRVGIARALAVEPELIIADESVSALDVSIQAQILNLFLALQRELDLAMVFIAHDLGVVRHLCQRMAVMYLGRIVETGPTEQVFHQPRHPYTQALVRAIPRLGDPEALPETLPGEPPSPLAIPPGCPFHPRCPHTMAHCRSTYPAAHGVSGVTVRCHLYRDGAPTTPLTKE